MVELNEKEAEILSSLKKYALASINNANTKDMIVFIVLAATEFGKEDEILEILDDPDNYGLSFEGISEKIISILPKVEIVDDE